MEEKKGSIIITYIGNQIFNAMSKTEDNGEINDEEDLPRYNASYEDAISICGMGISKEMQNSGNERILEITGVDFVTKKEVSGRPITKEDIKSIDIRLLRLSDYVIDSRKTRGDNEMISAISSMDRDNIVKNYNSLINLSREMVKKGIDIPIREMSDEDEIRMLDPNKLAAQGEVKISKK